MLALHFVGTAALTALHAFGYVHPAIAVAPPLVSLESNHPLPTFTDEAVALAVRVGGGTSVATVPVEVYTGSADAAAPAFEIVAGG